MVFIGQGLGSNTLAGAEDFMRFLDITDGYWPLLTGQLFPVLSVSIMGYKLWKKYRRNLTQKALEAREFLAKFTQRATCIGQNSLLTKATVENDLTLLDWRIKDKCGTETAELLAHQLLRTNLAFHNLFTVLAGLGTCMYPTTINDNNVKAHINCFDKIHEEMRDVKGEPGIVFEAITFAGMYAKSADQLFTAPIYEEWLLQRFDLEFDEQDQQNMASMDAVWNVEDTASQWERSQACISVVATQRASERTLIKLAAAVEAWMRTFAWKKWALFSHTRRPCKSVFNSLAETSEPMCKVAGTQPLASIDLSAPCAVDPGDWTCSEETCEESSEFGVSYHPAATCTDCGDCVASETCQCCEKRDFMGLWDGDATLMMA